ncbi:transcriptional regulator, BadM/Rrf2 family [Chlorobaculum parvum NCIB 8327]|uniref:Transcriptional regulator, BadM/Rrf2 family n=1 Tax=Chlorobaculum parvum (strain DSM 263 / NCIMB 8327) TaxID=517417 RepID=B3QPB9_CHLP8|nr:Rrf2 family transcriptional regulator [Chlorobaculum parvum]ACF11772.1 transcriptional regulator, BadM/Rrf2 family [Chlorobaculum parvum NCIB 8327]
MLQVSRKFEYGLHAVSYLAMKGPERPVTVKELASEIGFSQVFLAKAMQSLNKAGITRSVQGVKGGYTLARPAEQITVADIGVAIEGEPHLMRCSQENCDCEIESTCSHKAYMFNLQKRIQQLLAETTVASLLHNYHAPVSG